MDGVDEGGKRTRQKTRQFRTKQCLNTKKSFYGNRTRSYMSINDANIIMEEGLFAKFPTYLF